MVSAGLRAPLVDPAPSMPWVYLHPCSLVEQTRNAADLASTVVDPSNTTVTSRTFSVSHEFGGLQDEDPSHRGAADTVSTASASSAEAESDANPPPAASHAYSDLPQMPNLNGLEGAFAEQLIQLLMSAVQTEQAPRQTDEVTTRSMHWQLLRCGVHAVPHSGCIAEHELKS